MFFSSVRPSRSTLNSAMPAAIHVTITHQSSPDPFAGSGVSPAPISYPSVAYCPSPRVLSRSPTRLPSHAPDSESGVLPPLLIPSYVLPCTRHLTPFCPHHAEAEASVLGPADYISPSSSITIRFSNHRVHYGPFSGTVSSITHVFRDAYVFHVVDSSTSPPACLLLAVAPPSGAHPGWVAKCRRRHFASGSLEQSFAILPRTANIRYLNLFQHSSHSCIPALRRC